MDGIIIISDFLKDETMNSTWGLSFTRVAYAISCYVKKKMGLSNFQQHEIMKLLTFRQNVSCCSLCQIIKRNLRSCTCSDDTWLFHSVSWYDRAWTRVLRNNTKIYIIFNVNTVLSYTKQSNLIWKRQVLINNEIIEPNIHENSHMLLACENCIGNFEITSIPHAILPVSVALADTKQSYMSWTIRVFDRMTFD